MKLEVFRGRTASYNNRKAQIIQQASPPCRVGPHVGFSRGHSRLALVSTFWRSERFDYIEMRYAVLREKCFGTFSGCSVSGRTETSEVARMLLFLE